MMLNEGDAIPDVSVTLPGGGTRRLSECNGPLVVYFYPKDDTSGCTVEARDFSALLGDFAAIGVDVVGISKDSPERHAKFAAKHELTVPLATDADDSVCDAFGTWVEKSMYGKKYMGIERATFLFDGEGRLARVWRKVKVAGHAAHVLEAAREL